jgi:hypothetical protein
MARTGYWFQRARGRAIARTNKMKDARRLQRMLLRDDLTAMRDRLSPDTRYAISDEGVREVTRYALTQTVKWARDLNRDHRRYRAMHLEDGD